MFEPFRVFCNRNQGFAHLLFGRLLSEIGSFIDFIALTTYMFVLTKSSLMVGALISTRLISNLFGTLLTHRLVDQHNRKKLMVISDVIRACALLFLIAAPSSLTIAALFLTVSVLGVLTPLFNISLSASIPSMVDKEDIYQANAFNSAILGFSIVSGCLLAAYLPSIIGYKSIFLIDAFTFMISAAILLNSKDLIRKHVDLTDDIDREKFSVKQGAMSLSFIFSSILILRCIDAFGSSSHNVGIPMISQTFDPLRESFLAGWIWGMWGLGRFIISLWIGPTTARWMKKGMFPVLRYFSYATMAMSLGFILVFNVQSMFLICAIACFIGTVEAISEVLLLNLSQQEVASKRGRLMSKIFGAERLGLGVGTLCAGYIFQRVEPLDGTILFHGFHIFVVFGFLVLLYYRYSGSRINIDSR